MLLESLGLTVFLFIGLIVYKYLQVKGSKRFIPIPSGASVPVSSLGMKRGKRDRDRRRPALPASKEGSATVEAALLTPVFLCAVCCLIGIGQLLFIEGEIYYSASQTLRLCAKEKALVYYGVEDGGSGNRPKSIFDSVYDGGSLCNSFVEGGQGGIRLTLTESSVDRETLELKASYRLRIPLPMADRFSIGKRILLSQRIYSGYTEHGMTLEKKDQVVYVARHGTVYHRRPDCSYICLTISNPTEIAGIIKYSSLKPCARCIRKGRLPRQVYLTVSGDHYHSSLSCSGLKRSIRAVPYSQVKGMRKCSRCGGK